MNERLNESIPPLRPLTPKAAKYHEDVFLTNVCAKLDELHNVPLEIFVCGPNEGDNPLTKKRFDTVDTLRQLGHAAFVGEEEVQKLAELDEAKGRRAKPSNYYERLLADHSELIIVFCSSPGSIGETNEFLGAPAIARKTLVCIDEAHENGYIANGVIKAHETLTSNVIRYKSPDDIVSCKLKSTVLERVEAIQLAKAIRGVGH